MDINPTPLRTDLQDTIQALSAAICKNNVPTAIHILAANPDDRLTQHAMWLSIHRHCMPVLQALMERSLSKADCSRHLATAIDRGSIDAVDLLLPKSDVTYNQSEPLCNAASLGRQDIFDRLKSHWTAPYEHITKVAAAAARRGRLHIVQQCMELAPVDPSAILMSASMGGEVPVMRLVLPQCQSVDCVHAIFVADRYKRIDAVDLLWPTVQGHPNWEALAIDPNHQFDPSKSHLARLKQAKDASQELSDALHGSVVTQRNSKKI